MIFDNNDNSLYNNLLDSSEGYFDYCNGELHIHYTYENGKYLVLYKGKLCKNILFDSYNNIYNKENKKYIKFTNKNKVYLFDIDKKEFDNKIYNKEYINNNFTNYKKN